MLEYLLRLDCVLAISSNTWEASEATLTRELAAIEQVGVVLGKKAKFISESGRTSAQPMIEELNNLVANYRGLVGAHPELAADVITEPPAEQSRQSVVV
jgi:hypothetical protein